MERIQWSLKHNVLLKLTCVKSLAPATSTNITLLQSSNTAWTTLSDVSVEKNRGHERNAFFGKCKHENSDQKHAICNGQITFVDVLIQNKNISSFKFMELYVYLVSLRQNTPNILIAYQI